MVRSLTNVNILLNSYFPALFLLPAFGYTIFFSYTRRHYWSLIAGAVFGLGCLHQLAEVRTWIETGVLPAPNWAFGDVPETLIYLLAVSGFVYFTYFYDRNRELLTEKDVLLDEVHHRVRNNLQMIDSLLTTQMRKIENSESMAQLRNVRQRIKSYSLLHDKLHRSSSVRTVNVRDYVEDLCDVLETDFRPDLEGEITTEIEPLDLSVDKAVACGLIVNELVANSLQHSDPADAFLEVDVAFEHDGAYRLSVSDNGKNFEPEKFMDTAGGFSLVRHIAELDLNGDFKLTDGEGMTAEITFGKYQ